jgi:Uma2 family endonuclease
MGLQVVAESVRIPQWVDDLASFRRWAHSDGFPERGRFDFLGGELWIDMNGERLAENKAKGEFIGVLGTLVHELNRGTLLMRGLRLTNVPADLSTEPDFMYFSDEALDERRVVLARGDQSSEVEGAPDMVLEIVSHSSKEKDTVVLRNFYYKAGIREYRLVDPRGAKVGFDILRVGPRGYQATRRQGGWMKSAVFGKAFRLTRSEDARGLSQFTLEMR